MGAAVFLGFFRFIFFERTRPAASMRPPCFNYLSTSNDDLGRFLGIGKKSLFILGCAYRVSLLSQSVCLSVCVCVCVCEIFVVFTDCESCTRPISTKPGSMEAGEYGLTRGTCFVASCLEVAAVAGLLWISWCVLGAAVFRVFHDFTFSNSCTRPLTVRDPGQSASTR